jgi:hypothetical protein
MELVRCHAGRPVTAFTFRALAPLFDLAPFRLVGTPVGDRVYLEAQGPDGSTTLAATADLGQQAQGACIGAQVPLQEQSLQSFRAPGKLRKWMVLWPRSCTARM